MKINDNHEIQEHQYLNLLYNFKTYVFFLNYKFIFFIEINIYKIIGYIVIRSWNRLWNNYLKNVSNYNYNGDNFIFCDINIISYIILYSKSKKWNILSFLLDWSKEIRKIYWIIWIIALKWIRYSKLGNDFKLIKC